MRVAITTTIALAALLFAGPAGAAGGDGKEVGKGATAPAAAGGSSTGNTGAAADVPTDARGVDRAQSSGVDKSWEVGASYEFHRLLTAQSTDSVKNLSYIGFYARWDVTKYDRISLRGGAYQTGVIDNGDSPMRFDDLNLAYTRRFPLAGGVTMRLTGSVSAPTSYASQLASMIISPRLSLQADRKFGYLTLDARASGSGYIVRCASEGGYDCSVGGGGNPNAKAFVGGTIAADFAMPFHEPLSIGASAFTGYVWFYDVSGTPGGMVQQQQGTVMQATTQPVAQSYGAEVYVRYAFPSLAGFKTDLSVALANGDPTKGYGSVLHDGVQHIYAGFIQTAEVYAVLAARY